MFCPYCPNSQFAVDNYTLSLNDSIVQTVYGRVIDPSYAPLEDVTVTILSSDSCFDSFTAVTDQNG